jgi:acyl carrier protein
MDVAHRVRDFIIERRRFAGLPSVLSDDYALIENEVLDSMAIFEMIAFLEDEYDIRIEDEELIPENFGTIADISRLVHRVMG